jgi:hypothetical protein
VVDKVEPAVAVVELVEHQIQVELVQLVLLQQLTQSQYQEELMPQVELVELVVVEAITKVLVRLIREAEAVVVPLVMVVL